MEPPPQAIPSADESVEEAAPNGQPEGIASQNNDGAWRDELSARLNRYRSRRKAPPPRYPSLKLPFGSADHSSRSLPSENSTFSPLDSASSRALALDAVCPSSSPSAQPDVRAGESTAPVVRPSPPHSSAKIIEFPRSAWAPPPPPPDQLAGPVGEQLRILEVPEVAPPLPALGGITIEPVPSSEPERRPGVDFPLLGASLGRRMLACVFDGLIVACASALFGYIFWRIAGVRPPKVQLWGFAIAIPGLFWAAYQYLLITYSAATPGLLVARLELTRFDGSSTSRSLRRWRILASYLSALSLGMGYAWVFLDEDSLCWHDRITHTYLAPNKKAGSNRRC
jgi:RDD family